MSRDPIADAAAEESATRAARRIFEYLQTLADPANVEGMQRFGIAGDEMLGISVKELRAVARQLLRVRRSDARWRHEFAGALWESGVHEARLLAVFAEDPAMVTREQAESWAAASHTWDLTDQLCMNVLDTTPFAYELASEWTHRESEFVKRAGFALIASLAWHDKGAPDERFLAFLDDIEREAGDPRNFVTKAVDWALRHIGKRSAALHGPALKRARLLATHEERAARRVGRVAVRELESEAVARRLGL